VLIDIPVGTEELVDEILMAKGPLMFNGAFIADSDVELTDPMLTAPGIPGTGGPLVV
jgi:hypothetical protein